MYAWWLFVIAGHGWKAQASRSQHGRRCYPHQGPSRQVLWHLITLARSIANIEYDNAIHSSATKPPYFVSYWPGQVDTDICWFWFTVTFRSSLHPIFHCSRPFCEIYFPELLFHLWTMVLSRWNGYLVSIWNLSSLHWSPYHCFRCATYWPNINHLSLPVALRFLHSQAKLIMILDSLQKYIEAELTEQSLQVFFCQIW